MRLFFASFLDPELARSYESLIAGVVADVPRAIRPVPKGTHHLTIAFLGNLSEPDAGRCMEVLDVARGLRAIPITMAPPRILRARKTPRLICADVVEGRDRATELQRFVCGGLVERLPQLDLRPKPPHVTLARFAKSATREAGRLVTDSLAGREGPGAVRSGRLDALHLVKSTLTPSGPIYETVGKTVLAD
jgi:2'-5' RNA ligase